MGPYDYYVYSNSLVDEVKDLNDIPIKTVGDSWVTVGDVGKAEDSNQIQYNVVRVDGQRSCYIPIMKQGGNTNTIAVVNGVRDLIGHLLNIPKQMTANLVFDQSVFVKEAIKTLLHEGLLGLLLTSLMILIFLGSLRATSAVFLSIPLSALATFVVLYMMDSTVNTMILGGLALAFSRIIDNSVISLENIYRHLEGGALPAVAAEVGGNEVSLAVLAATLTTVIVFFPVTFLYGVSKFLFSALALAVVISLFASYIVAMTVIPLFCSSFSSRSITKGPPRRMGSMKLSRQVTRSLLGGQVQRRLQPAFQQAAGFLRALGAAGPGAAGPHRGHSLRGISPQPGPLSFSGAVFLSRTDAGQFTINLKAPTGTRIEVTEQYVAKVENLIKKVVDPEDYKLVVSNIGVVPDFSALYTTNAGPYTATVQVQLQDDHRRSSFYYMHEVQKQISEQFPEVRTFFSSGSMVDAILNMGMPAPIDVQVSSSDLPRSYRIAQDLAGQIQKLPGVGEVYIPQDMNYPALRLDINRVHAGELGLSQKDVVDNVITALNSNLMIAPNYWVDRKTGNDYFLTVQYFENGSPAIHNLGDLTNIPLRAPNLKDPTTLGSVVQLTHTQTPTEVDHYQIQRITDVYVTPLGEDLGKIADGIRSILKNASIPGNVRVNLRGMVQGMTESFQSFAAGLSLAALLLYLILVAQFKSFKDPLLIMLAIPMGFIGVLVVLPLTHTTLNVMSLMGVLMLVGIAASNSILIVEFAHRLEEQGESVESAVINSCRVRLRPILMTSLATIIGMLPMALKMGTGSEQYAPLALAIIGGLIASVLLTVFIVPAAYLLVYGGRQDRQPEAGGATQ